MTGPWMLSPKAKIKFKINIKQNRGAYPGLGQAKHAHRFISPPRHLLLSPSNSSVSPLYLSQPSLTCAQQQYRRPTRRPAPAKRYRGGLRRWGWPW